MHNLGRPRLSRAPVRGNEPGLYSILGVMSAVVHYPLHRFTYSTAGETVYNITIPAYFSNLPIMVSVWTMTVESDDDSRDSVLVVLNCKLFGLESTIKNHWQQCE